MTDATTQTAVETEAQAVPAAEDNGAQAGDLEKFLSDFETSTKPTQPAPKVDAGSEVEVLKKRLDTLEVQQRAEREAADTKKAISELKGDLDVPEFVVRGWVSDRAEADPRIQQIWANRDSNPAAFKRLLSEMRGQLAKEAPKFVRGPDPNATADREAVAAAIKGASSKAPEEKQPDLKNMTDQELAAWRKKAYGY